MGGLRVLLAVALAWLGAVITMAAPADALAPHDRPRIGLVLGGGGAKGFAHIGVIAELERLHIPVDVVTGTSMGAVVGSLYASGNDAAQVDGIAHAIDWQTLFSDALPRDQQSFRRKREQRAILLDARLGLENGRPVLPKGALGGRKLYVKLQELLLHSRTIEDFDRLPIPYRAVATDIVTGHEVVMKDGDIASAVFASMAIPAGFPPVERNGLLLVDGGIVNNLPIDLARSMGVDIVIAVDVGAQPLARDKITDALDVLNQMQLLFGYERIRTQIASLGGRDVLISPDISQLSTTGFDKLDLAIANGHAAARVVAARLAPLALNDADWAAYLAARRARIPNAPIRVDSIRIANASRVPDAEVAGLVTIRPGEMVDGPGLAKQVARLYDSDAFDSVRYDLAGHDGERALVFTTHGNPGASKYLQFGGQFGTSLGRGATFQAAASYTDLDFLGTGAEWRGYASLGTEVHLDVGLYKSFGRFYVEPVAFLDRTNAAIIQTNNEAVDGRLQLNSAGAGSDAGYTFGNWGDIRLGARIGGINPRSNSVDTGLPSGWSRDVTWRASFNVDTLDSLLFPRKGVIGSIAYIDHVGALGGEFRRNQFSVSATAPFCWGRNTVVVGGRLGTTGGDRGDFIGDYRLGGFLNLSGLPQNGLVGRQQLIGRVVGYRRISDRSPIMDLPIYVGASLEAGNVFAETSDISLGRLRVGGSIFVAADTLIGPVWFAYGHAGGGHDAIYLVLGRVF